ncbi:uncharacterized protein E0L32_009285 [Thyridium curvatum]|uniref:UmuC domain-containing protein n=1 Tax=Thyridium curvatum TaxID=1093900 RepID=A0A507AJF8_9PEZI|nr:uncharacterized protein E0L32_009285 [Thyridium curvatum]TPX09542.1 hypothetical protein E0L32_009285 [Thyridium curvatum]
MERPRISQPRRHDDRVILHFDYDCFYAQVAENRKPALKSLPLGIRQKGILATCNYEARRRGVKKLMVIHEARKICPELVLVEGEDLAPFRDVSKHLYTLLRSYSWSAKVERLGLDEVYFDATDMVTYNLELLNHNTLTQSFFYLSRDDPEKGFDFDASRVMGRTVGSPPKVVAGYESPVYMRLLLASHLARFLRMKVEDEGYTSACGISTNKVLSKMAGSQNKPRNQTTLLTLHDPDVLSFVDQHRLRQIPGIGSKTSRVLEAHILGHEVSQDAHSLDCAVTAGQVRTHADTTPGTLERLLGGPGAEKGLGEKVWCLLHGVDDTLVKPASDIPTQISIEDTYQGLNEPGEILRELRKLSHSLLRRMHVDLVVDNIESPGQRWVARPKTLRLTTRPKTSMAEGRPYNFQRCSRSQALPNFAFSLVLERGEIVDKLVDECLLPMFRRLNPGQDKGWNTGLLNICVANMVFTGSDDATGSGRDISVMFRRQEETLKQFTAYDDSPRPVQGQDGDGQDDGRDAQESRALESQEQEVAWDDSNQSDLEDDGWCGWDGAELCPQCGRLLPTFAISAHQRFHILGA